MSFELWNRRYTGSKYKLADWIVKLIFENCKGSSFCDIFAGTGIMAAKMLPNIHTLYLNDLLYSNEVIYNAFFAQQKFDLKKLDRYCTYFSSFNFDDIETNYMSENYGNKFFSFNDAKLIGKIRDEIETANVNKKEKAILIASLLYSADKSANTVGHYDAYIKGHKLVDKFKFNLIKPILSDAKISISRQDANIFAETLECDIVYIDPPYNSRQYSRFYHVLENIAKWQKPQLFGEALKPYPENMSDYCKSSATVVFADLIHRLNCKYIVVSYNNTYQSKSSSSKNKISLENLAAILSNKGSVKAFEQKHNYFNAGKTEFPDHKEFLYIVEVNK